MEKRDVDRLVQGVEALVARGGVEVVKTTCPCCGYKTLPSGPGNYELCPVCYWEDDGEQVVRPWAGDGPNGISLYEGQANYEAYGVCDVESRQAVRPPAPDEPRDETWQRYEPSQRECELIDRQLRRRDLEEAARETWPAPE